MRSRAQSIETPTPKVEVMVHTSENGCDEDSEYNDNYWFPVESVQRHVSAHLRLKYMNTSYETSEWDFDVSGFFRGDKGYYINGYCHIKKRSIRLSSMGISDVIDLETGECITDINTYLEVIYKDSDGYLKDLLFDEYGWAVYVLVYMASSSGSLVKKEREVISQFIASLPKFSSLDSEWIDVQLKKLYRPGKMEIRNWVKKAIASGNNFSLIEPAVAQLETFQKKDNNEFWTLKRYIQKQAGVVGNGSLTSPSGGQATSNLLLPF